MSGGAREIERKFLVSKLPVERHDFAVITQGYLLNEEDATIRVELVDRRHQRPGKFQAYLCVKSPRSGIDREEVEFPISEKLGYKLLPASGRQKISKLYSKVVFGSHTWEIDEYLGANLGLVVAEVELGSVDESFDLPYWCGGEVTDDPRYTNANLASRPFSTW